MALRLFNSLSGRKEPFTAKDRKVKMFVCGPTVYEYAHLGHARTYIAFDIIARYLTYLGYTVQYLMNITDVAEKLVQRSQEQKREPLELAGEFENCFLEDMRTLGINTVERYINASRHIPEMISQVTGLIDRGMAYETDTGVYFEVKKFPKFGSLSHQTTEEIGLRRLELCSTKKNPEDFSVWRKYDGGLGWDSPWGFGRPGWHIEDTAIAMTNLGDTYDIHGGATELIFPHHEAEIAQAEALTGKSPYVRFWLHTGLVHLGGRKMSKSLGNVIRIRDALKEYRAAELRYYFASFNYRQPVTFSKQTMKRAKRKLESLEKNLRDFLASKPGSGKNGRKLVSIIRTEEAKFRKYMDDDLDTQKALTVLQKLSRTLHQFSKLNRRVDQASKDVVERTFRKMAGVFGLMPSPE